MVINLLRQPRDKHKESALQQMLACFRTVNSYTLSMQETKCERAEVIQVIPADIKVALDLDEYITGLGQKQSERDDEDEVRQRPFFPLFHCHDVRSLLYQDRLWTMTGKENNTLLKTPFIHENIWYIYGI